MDFRQLEYFVNIAKTENMGTSAEALHISQPALSMSIKRLEEELGTTLFDRRNHSIKLNSYGRLFLRYARECLATLESGKKELSEAIDKKNRKVTISCPAFYLTGIIFDRFLSLHPEASVEYCSVQYWQAEEAVQNNKIDVLISSVVGSSDKLENIRLAKRNMGIICSGNHPFAGKKSISVSELKTERHVSYPDIKQPRLDFELLCSKSGFKPNVVFESDSLTTLLGMCRKGIGLLSSSRESTQYMDMTDLVFVPFEESADDAATTLYMICRKDNTNPLVADLKKIIIENITED